MNAKGVILLFIAVLTALASPARSAPHRGRVVRVGSFPSPGWCDVQPDGSRTGLVPDWTTELAVRCGWRIKWVNALWSTAFDQLERGEIDLLVGAMSSKQRKQRVLFPNTPFILFPYFLFGHEGDVRLARGVRGLEGARIGLIRGYWHNDVLHGYLQRKGVREWTPVVFNTEQELNRAFSCGEVDAALGDLTSSVKGQKAIPIIAFPPIPLFTAVTPRRPDLLAEIEYATSAILMATPQLVRQMHERHLSDALLAKPLVDTTTDSDLARAMVEVSRENHLSGLEDISGLRGDTRLQRVLIGVVILFAVFSAVVMLLFLWLYRRAETGMRARANFLALMSHEIRTPLNIVVGFAENLQRPSLSPEQIRDSADGLHRSAQALLSLVNDVLVLSKLDAHRMDVLNGTCDCEAVFQEMDRMFAARFREKGVDFICRADHVPPLRLRDACLRQILLNLVGNAFKFTSHGAVSCTATVSEEAPGRVTFILVVRDTGQGMDPEQLEIVFDPFTQAGSACRDQFTQGTGLGLAIVERLVRAAGGTVDVRSECKKGTVFVIRIPGLSVINRPQTPSEGLLHPPLAECRPLKVLVVDDVALNRKIIQLHLQSLGHTDIRTAGNGTEAVALLEQSLPDVVLSDIWMPEMDGAELSRVVTSRWPGIPLVAVTADTDANDNFDMSRFVATLTKPITAAAIARALAICQAQKGN